MDTLAHGLWGGAAFGQKSRQWKWAFILGMCPDLFSFGPFFLTHIGDVGERIAHHQFGRSGHPLIPAYVYHAYNVTHSLVIFALLAIVAWRLWGRHAWPFGAWGLHILCDIPTHSTRFFPTPYLWPFHTPFVDGVPWARGRFMLVNYALIAMTYAAIHIHRGRNPQDSGRLGGGAEGQAEGGVIGRRP